MNYSFIMRFIDQVFVIDLSSTLALMSSLDHREILIIVPRSVVDASVTINVLELHRQLYTVWNEVAR